MKVLADHPRVEGLVEREGAHLPAQVSDFHQEIYHESIVDQSSSTSIISGASSMINCPASLDIYMLGNFSSSCPS